MILPALLTLKVNCPQGGDLSGLIFQMRVISGTKNPYHIYFPKTTADGTACLASENFRGQFEDYHEFIMDYNGSIAAASDMVSFMLFNPRGLLEDKGETSQWPLFKFERSVWKSRQEKINYFVSCRNLEYYFFEESVRVPADGIIRLTVGRKV